MSIQMRFEKQLIILLEFVCELHHLTKILSRVLVRTVFAELSNQSLPSSALQKCETKCWGQQLYISMVKFGAVLSPLGVDCNI